MDPLEMPAAFTVADQASIEAQRRFMRSTRIQLLLLIAAGASGVFTVRSGRLDLAALAGGVMLLLAAFLRLRLVRSRPHGLWYQARAAAESAKTLVCRYAMGGKPFPVGDPDVDSQFVAQLRDIFEGLARAPDPSSGSFAPTASMGRLRSSSLDERKAAYEDGRVRDQETWYRAKSDWNRRRARAWGVAILVLQVTAAVGAFLKGFGVIDIDLFGLAAAIVASAAAWAEARQHGTLASSYAVAADELGAIRRLLAEPRTEDEWAMFVDEAEKAVSREHTLWKASSSRRKPVSLT